MQLNTFSIGSHVRFQPPVVWVIFCMKTLKAGYLAIDQFNRSVYQSSSTAQYQTLINLNCTQNLLKFYVNCQLVP